MKRILVVLLLLIVTACTSSTEYGDCIGITQKEKPGLDYQVSALNLALAIIFFEAVLPPVFVIAKEFKCPVGKTDGN